MIEPVTSLLLVSYLACARLDTNNPDYFKSTSNELSTGDNFSELETHYKITEDFIPATEFLLAPQLLSQAPYDRVKSIKNELDSYSYLEDGWDGENSSKPSVEAVARAKDLLDKLPSGLPNPIPMISNEGELGFYWNNENFYADLHLEDEPNISLYVRKKTEEFEEYFYDNLPEESLTSNWIKDNVSILYSA